MALSGIPPKKRPCRLTPTLAVSAGSRLSAICVQPLYGARSNRISRRPLLVAFALLGTIFTVPLLTAIRNASGPWEAFAGLCATLLQLKNR
ncbi:hypothetical protein RCH14_002776 [Massilia sp. MP_M2]|uniref:hypothetical protein n=1 Tax=Massilia sp. MP_M2 TaxID=3071713 RepID=UPI00319EB0C6